MRLRSVGVVCQVVVEQHPALGIDHDPDQPRRPFVAHHVTRPRAVPVAALPAAILEVELDLHRKLQ